MQQIAYEFLSMFHSNYGHIFIISEIKRDIGRKSRSYPTPQSGGLTRNIAITFGVEKLEGWLPDSEKVENMFTRFDTNATNRQTDTAQRYRLRLCMHRVAETLLKSAANISRYDAMRNSLPPVTVNNNRQP